MNYSLVKAILEGTWAVSAQTFLQYDPIARGIIRHGLEFEVEPEAKDTIPFQLAPGATYDSRHASGSKPKEGVVAVTPLIGVMLKYDTSCGPRGTTTIAKRLQNADEDPGVDAHVLLVDSGGGQAASVSPLAYTIQNLKKPIVAYCDNMMASAALYAGSHCKEIWASSEMDVIGSVGVMIGLQGREAISEDKDGVKHIRLYSDHSPEKNIEFEEALKGNYKVVKEKLLNPLDKRFMEDMKQNLPGVTEEQLKGGTQFARDLVGTMIHKIGSLQEAAQRALELAHPEAETDSKTHNQSNMSKSEFKALATVAGVPSFEVSNEGIFLSTDQATSAEEALGRLEAAEAAIEGLEEGETVKGLKQSNATLTQKNKDLNAENERLSKDPEAKETTAHSDGDDKEKKNIDPEAEALYGLSKVK